MCRISVAVLTLSVYALAFNDPASGKFQPCSPVNRITRQQKIDMLHVGVKIISGCSFKMIAANRVTWKKDVIAAIPRLIHFVCVAFTVPYNYYGSQINRLSPKFVKNVSEVVPVWIKILTRLGEDSSVSPMFCFWVNTNATRYRACYERAELYRMLVIAMRCADHSVHLLTPVYLEQFVYFLRTGVSRLVDSGVINYFIG